MPLSKRPDPRLVRTDDAWLTLPNSAGVPVEICAGVDVPIESAAVDEQGARHRPAAPPTPTCGASR